MIEMFKQMSHFFNVFVLNSVDSLRSTIAAVIIGISTVTVVAGTTVGVRFDGEVSINVGDSDDYLNIYDRSGITIKTSCGMARFH